jgi:Tol biopolymer transport system component
MRRCQRSVASIAGLSADGIAFSQDGEWIADSLWPERTLWRSRVDGSSPLQLTSPSIEALAPRLSPDGRTVAYMAHSKGDQGRWNIYLMPASGESAGPVLPADSDYATPSWSPDGSALVFGGVTWLNRYRKSTSVRSIDLRTRQVAQLAGSEGLWAPKWSPTVNT